MKKYPITFDEIVKEMGMRKDTIEKEIKKMEKEGIIALDILPDKIFVRLNRLDFRFFNEKKIDRNIRIEEENLNLKTSDKKLKVIEDENIGYI